MSWKERIGGGIVIVVLVAFVLALGMSVIFMIGNWQEIKELKEISYDYDLQDPTYYEVKDFLAFDVTSSKVGGSYLWSSYVCVDFGADVKKNAIAENIRCAGVFILFNETIFGDERRGHVIVAFRTTDKGIIFVEPQTDEEVEVAVGIRYFRDNGLEEWVADDFDDTITEIEIYWPK